MKVLLKRILSLLLVLTVSVILYVLTAFILINVKVNSSESLRNQKTNTSQIYLSTNGVHLDLIVPVNLLTSNLKQGLYLGSQDAFVAFGWGDADFYLNTPTWSDLTFITAVKALFLKSSTLMHVSRFQNIDHDWVKVAINDDQLKKINSYLEGSFKTDIKNQKQLIPNASYFTNDSFYKANGSYSVLKTCNTWVNQGFKYSGLTACYWTPFDFGLLGIYE